MQETEPNFLTLMKVTESYRKFSFIRFVATDFKIRYNQKFLLCQTLIALIACLQVHVLCLKTNKQGGWEGGNFCDNHFESSQNFDVKPLMYR